MSQNYSTHSKPEDLQLEQCNNPDQIEEVLCTLVEELITAESDDQASAVVDCIGRHKREFADALRRTKLAAAAKVADPQARSIDKPVK